VSHEIVFEFCVRLAAGLACMIVATSIRTVGASFFRTLTLTVLGLSVLALLSGPEWLSPGAALALGSAVLAFVAFAAWTLGRPAFGHTAAWLLLASIGGCLVWQQVSAPQVPWPDKTLGLTRAASSAVLMGSMVAAMLLGHSYLIAPTMSIEPLQRMVGWLVGAIAVRAAVAGVSHIPSLRTAGTSVVGDSSDALWWEMVCARWLIGIVGPAVIAWMVWQTARIRSTQSATGILYAGVILVFFGELLGQLLRI
jgi:hypothetical protein